MRDVTPAGGHVQRCLLTLLALGATCVPIATAQTAQDFSVRATATVPAGTTIARVALPAATIAARAALARSVDSSQFERPAFRL